MRSLNNQSIKKTQSYRMVRLERKLHSILATYFLSNSAKFSDIKGFVSIIRVLISADVRFAKVYVSFFSTEETITDKDMENNIEILKENQPDLQRYLGQNWAARNCPHIERWVVDKSLDNVEFVYNALEV